jgi:pimeloyl-ACP methyl ester carboxylesterase
MPYAELGGLRLYYERAGGGDPELLFVHGWCCDRTAFQPQFDHFARTHAVTSLDLRGCGRSDRPEDGYGIRDLTDDVARFCGVVGIEQPVVVGHSLGGMIAVELGARYPSLPRALVLVDPGPIDPLPETVKFFDAAAEQLAGPRGEEVRRLWVEDMGARDEELARWIADLMCAVPLPVATAVVSRLNDWNGVGALGLCSLPTLLLRPRLAANPEALRLLEIKPDLEVGITVGAGHFHQLEVPDQVNAMIDRFLELAAGGSARS